MTDTDVRNALLARVETTYLEWLVMPSGSPLAAEKRNAYHKARAALREHDAQAEGAPPAQPIDPSSKE